MRRIALALAASMALVVGVGAAGAAEAPMVAAKSTAISGVSGVQLPITEKSTKTGEIVVARRGRRVGRGIAIGALIVGAAVIASEAARADRHRARRHRRSCRKWLRRCNRGNDRACWRYDNRC